MAPLTFRSIWISDVHLGTRNLQNEKLLDFLLQTESEFLYLVGDILDLIQAQRRWYWPPTNDRIVQTVLAKAAGGTKVIYIPGNHDHMLRKFDGCTLNNIRIQRRAIHETVDGRRYLVLHGDQFDPVVQNIPWLATLGSIAYDLLLFTNRWFNLGRRAMNREYRSISSIAKNQVKIVVNYIGRFEKAVAAAAQEHQVDGLICGHIHRAGVREIEQVLYTNSGDWVESCTALAENMSGHLGVIDWQTQQPLRKAIANQYYEDLYRNRCLASPN
ncbi:MAG: UDP-2,3-diacylglucosamine diphosphatase [Desulfobulbus sp.]|jgi:UDP-2,3-diacylglucosamine pyrophosphatase LpxH